MVVSASILLRAERAGQFFGSAQGVSILRCVEDGHRRHLLWRWRIIAGRVVRDTRPAFVCHDLEAARAMIPADYAYADADDDGESWVRVAPC